MPAWRWCVLAGLATLVVSVLFGRVPGLASCNAHAGGGSSAVLALEFARNAADITALFGSEPCTSRLVAAQRQALWLDMLAFIPAYTLFLLSAVVALRRADLGFALLAFNLFMIAAALDLIEGLILFRLLGELPGTERGFTGLFWTVRPKFALLGLGEITLALMLWRGALGAKVAAGAMAAGGVVSLVYLVRAPLDPAMMKGHMMAWSALLVVAAVGALRPALLGLPTSFMRSPVVESGPVA